MEFAFLSQGTITALIGFLCVLIAAPLLVTSLNSFRDSMAPGGPSATRIRSHRLMRLFRSYLLVGIASLLMVIGILRLTSTETWLAVFNPGAAACIEMTCR